MENHQGNYKEGSLSLIQTVSLGTGVMIGAGILALTGQIAELAGSFYIYAFLSAALVAGASAYSYVVLARAFPSAGGIAMFFAKIYGKGLVTATCALMMALTMVINESLVARTFASYALQPFSVSEAVAGWLTPALAVGVLVFAYIINVSGNNVVGRFSVATSVIKVGGILIFAGAALVASKSIVQPLIPEPSQSTGAIGFLAATALGVLAYKGFTTITNSGSEVVEPSKNIGRAIVISLVACVVVYLLVALSVGANLSLDELIAAKDFALAQAARPALGDAGLWFTVVVAVVATSAALIASTFAVSRMLAMLTDMKLVPHSHFGMSGSIQRHTLTYAVVIAIFLAVFFDLSRIASLGVVLYLLMDSAIHFGLLRAKPKDVQCNKFVVLSALVLDLTVLCAFVVMKIKNDPLIIGIAFGTTLIIFMIEYFFLERHTSHSGHAH